VVDTNGGFMQSLASLSCRTSAAHVSWQAGCVAGLQLLAQNGVMASCARAGCMGAQGLCVWCGAREEVAVWCSRMLSQSSAAGIGFLFS
jgi:hypothetical protein